MKNDYYTYAFLRDDGTPYYIGKGRGERAFRKRKGRVQPPSVKSRILILKKDLTEEEAFKHEIYLIAVLGRKDIGTGILWNFTDGGEGGAGKRLSAETRQKISEAQKGKKLSEETKQRIKEAKKKVSPETREKMRQAKLGTKHTPETLQKLSDAKRGNKNPNKKGLSEQHRQNIAEGQRRRWARERETALYGEP
jgi:hypothetical protein